MFNESVADGISKWKMSDVGDFVSSPDSIFRFRWEKRESSHEFQKCSGKNVKTTPGQIRLESVPSPDVPIPVTVPDPRDKKNNVCIVSIRNSELSDDSFSQKAEEAFRGNFRGLNN